jgi:hypothetical protein
MPIFTSFLPLASVVNFEIEGQLAAWTGEYIKIRKNSQRPVTGGSGLKVRAPAMHPEHIAFGHPYSAYAIVSCRYPLIYVGISNRGPIGLAARLHKHLNKFLAIPASATHHPKNWREHGRQRYTDNFAAIQNRPPGIWMLDDLRIAYICSPATLKNNEGYILNHFVNVTRTRFPDESIHVLNGNRPRQEPIAIEWPVNATDPL